MEILFFFQWIALFFKVNFSFKKKLVCRPCLKIPDRLESKRRLYTDLIKNVQDKTNGFIETDCCDSLLFSGLIGACSGVAVDLYKAKKPDGSWTRNPNFECYPNHSKSSISRDMFMGVMWFLWRKSDWKSLTDLYRFGFIQDWVMGDGPLDCTYFSPPFRNTLLDLVATEGEKPRYVELLVDPIKDHQRHIVALNLILRGEARGYLYSNEVRLLGHFAKLQPHNALFQYGYHRYTDGDYSSVIDFLMNQNFFPEDRLPEITDRNCRWLWERDEHSEHWERNTADHHTHSGGDFLFIAQLLHL